MSRFLRLFFKDIREAEGALGRAGSEADGAIEGVVGEIKSGSDDLFAQTQMNVESELEMWNFNASEGFGNGIREGKDLSRATIEEEFFGNIEKESLSKVDKKSHSSFENESLSIFENESLANIENIQPVSRIKNIWESAKTLGKWIGIEVGKGAAFAAGMMAVERLFRKEAEISHSPKDDKRLGIITAISKANDSIKSIFRDWLVWVAKHQDDRDKYGSITVEDISISRFEIFQEKLGNLSLFRDTKVTPALSKAVKDKGVENAQDLLEEFIRYTQKCLDVSKGIQAKGDEPMVSDGLEDHHAEFEKTMKDLKDFQAKA